LQIVAKDVNGDNAPDVLVSTAWEHRQIAVFLNDGYGHFTPVDPDRYPDAAQSSGSYWSYTQIPLCESGILVRFENWTSEAATKNRFPDGPEQRQIFFRDASRVAARFVSISVLGRAPPSFVRLA
jgi:hypothetical protein